MDLAMEFPMAMVGSFFLELWPFEETLFMQIISTNDRISMKLHRNFQNQE